MSLFCRALRASTDRLIVTQVQHSQTHSQNLLIDREDSLCKSWQSGSTLCIMLHINVWCNLAHVYVASLNTNSVVLCVDEGGDDWWKAKFGSIKFHVHSEPNHRQRTNTEDPYDDPSCTVGASFHKISATGTPFLIELSTALLLEVRILGMRLFVAWIEVLVASHVYLECK